MNRIFLIVSLSAMTLCAQYPAIVKKANIAVTINGKTREFQAGEKTILKPGDVVCFVSGNGRLVIRSDQFRTQVSRHGSKCKFMPIIDDKKEGIEKGVLLEHFAKAHEEGVYGVSRGVESEKTYTKEIHIAGKQRYLAIQNDQWGPLPVTLKIIAPDGKVLYESRNEKNLISSFAVPVDKIKDGSILEISNRFGDLLVKSKIKLLH